MKKISFIGIFIAAAMTMSAQVSLVKEAKRDFGTVKTYKEYQKALQALTPAFNDAETAKQAETFYIPAKAGFVLFDNLYGQKQFGKDVNLVEMSDALMDGYNLGLMVLDLDTVVDAKGKVKTKFSKDIVSQICGHANDFSNAGSIYWGEKDFKKSYEGFTTYLAIPGNPRFGKMAPAALPDTIAAELNMYRAYAAMNAQMLPEALQAFDEMVALGGVQDTVAYDFAFNAAYNNERDYARMLKYTAQAYERFQLPRFLGLMVNIYIDEKDYDTARKLLADAIANDPNNAEYYYSQGIMCQNLGELDNAKAAYKKATELDPKNAKALFAYGTMLATEFDALDAEASANLSQSEYNKYFVETLKPLLLEITKYCEASYAADEEMTDALRTLRSVYYRLNDGENLKRVENLLL